MNTRETWDAQADRHPPQGAAVCPAIAHPEQHEASALREITRYRESGLVLASRR